MLLLPGFFNSANSKTHAFKPVTVPQVTLSWISIVEKK